MKLVFGNDPILRTETKRFDFENPPMDPEELYTEMRDIMISKRGIGLSANQVGLPYQVFVFGLPTDPDGVIGVFNPRITNYSEREEYYEEGCLSFPGLYTKIKRPTEIRARYTTHNGVTGTRNFDGLMARAFQHEYDHLYGIVYTSRASKIHLDRAYRQKKKLDKIKKSRS